jgi:hypothetical protein
LSITDVLGIGRQAMHAFAYFELRINAPLARSNARLELWRIIRIF